MATDMNRKANDLVTRLRQKAAQAPDDMPTNAKGLATEATGTAQDLADSAKDSVNKDIRTIQRGNASMDDKDTISNTLDIVTITLMSSSIIGSIVLWFQGKREAAIFVGLWPPTFVAFGALLKQTFGKTKAG